MMLTVLRSLLLVKIFAAATEQVKQYAAQYTEGFSENESLILLLKVRNTFYSVCRKFNNAVFYKISEKI